MPSPIRALALAALPLLAGCNEDWCARFNLDCDQEAAVDLTLETDADGDAWPADQDCNDNNSLIFPGGVELCDGLDNDCDGVVDDGIEGVRDWFEDNDADGFGDPDRSVTACQPPGGTARYSADGTDCDDTNAAVHPNAVEVCSTTFDDDCSGAAQDNAIDGTPARPDADADGYGDADAPLSIRCELGDGWVVDAFQLDCDDADPEVHPAATEVCDDDDTDEDCDGFADNYDSNVLTSTTDWFYYDQDGDGHGWAGTRARLCDPWSVYVAPSDDCDDTDPLVYPGADEACDGVDQDCDGEIDEEAVIGPSFYADADGDGWGDDATAVVACAQPADRVPDGGDCDDADPRIHPEADESDCDDPVDYNCDGSVGLADADADGSPACEDCDDADPARSPLLTEVCDPLDVDEDCSLAADDADPGLDPSTRIAWYEDADADGYGDGSATTACEPPDPAWVEQAGDCAPADPAVSPAAAEVCDDGVDNNCDGSGAGCVIPAASTLSAATVTFTATISNEQFGDDLAWAGDLDGDGGDDLVVGGPQYATGSGRVWVFWGSRLGAARGSASVPVATTEMALYSRISGDHLGEAVAGGGDLDGDGYADLVIGAPFRDALATNNGVAWLLHGPVTTPGGYYAEDLATGAVYGASDSDFAGSALSAAGDVDGDGVDDLLVGNLGWSGGEAAVFLMAGPLTGPRFTSGGVASIGASTGTSSSIALAGGGDIDGDGFDDVLVGARGWGSKGGAAVFLGPLDGALTFDDAAVQLEGSFSRDFGGSSVGVVGDADGDGLDDVAIGAESAWVGGTDAGAAYLFTGATLSGLASADLDEADLVVQGDTTGGQAGASVSGGDFDGDGFADLATGGRTSGAVLGGAVWVFLGPTSGTVSVSAADHTMEATVSNRRAGTSVALDGDADGNGRDDLIIGAPGANSSAGISYLFRSHAE